MKTSFFAIIGSVFTLSVYAQNANLVGSWLLTRVEVGSDVHQPYYTIEFNANGSIIAMDMEVGTWKVQKDKLSMKSERDREFNGISKIITVSKTELVLIKDGAKLFYQRVDTEAITKANKASGFIGIWRIRNLEGATKILKFDAPDVYTYINATNGMTEKGSGTWIFEPKEKTLIIIGNNYDIRGKNSVLTLNKNEVAFENNGVLISGTKEAEQPIERLTFTQEEIPEEPSEEYQLPWYDKYAMLDYLDSVNYLTFRKGTLLEGVQVIKYSNVFSEIEVNQEDQSVTFHNLGIYDGDTAQFSENHKGGMMNNRNNFFPKEEPWPYKILGLEEVTVPAGAFKCTVIIATDGDTKYKFWMINNKPGVYAKTIIEGVDPFDKLDYSIIELEEIKQK